MSGSSNRVAGGSTRRGSGNARQDARQYTREWYDKMVEIWKDRMAVVGAIDTGALHRSIGGGGMNISDSFSQLTFQYLTYGIYVDLGVGNGYRHGNSGNLPFLDPVYRHEHHKGRQRQRKPWFNKSWYISTMVLKDKLAELIGEEFSGIFDNLTDRERG